MGVSTDGIIAFGIVLDEGQELPWDDEPGDGDFEDWWRKVNGWTEDTLALKATQEAFETYAAKGFFMPPGMLVKQVNAIQEDNRLKTSSMSREIASARICMMV